MKKHPTLLILAAGLGSRYGGVKQIDKLGKSGETIIDFSIYDAVAAGIKKVVFVIRKEIEREFFETVQKKLPAEIETVAVFQELSDHPENIKYTTERKKPWGTGHAVLSASRAIDEPFIVINADDFYGREAYQEIVNFAGKIPRNESLYALAGYKLEQTLSDFGSVARGICETDENGFLKSIVERTKILREDGKIFFENGSGDKHFFTGEETVSMNMFFFTPDIFRRLEERFKKFLIENKDDPEAEFYLPQAVNHLIKERKARVKVIPTQAEWFGLTYENDKAIAKEKIRRLIDESKYPEKLWSR